MEKQLNYIVNCQYQDRKPWRLARYLRVDLTRKEMKLEPRELYHSVILELEDG